MELSHVSKSGTREGQTRYTKEQQEGTGRTGKVGRRGREKGGDEEGGDESRLHPEAWGRTTPRSPPHRQGPRLSGTLQSWSPFCLKLTQSPNFIILKLYKYKYLTKPFTGFKETLIPFG